MSKKQRAALARGRQKQVSRRKAKGQGKYCKVLRKGAKSTTRCYKSESALWNSISGKSGAFSAITIYKRKNG